MAVRCETYWKSVENAQNSPPNISTMSHNKITPIEKLVQLSVENRLNFKQNEKEHAIEITNFTDVFRPIYYFARLCGQMPFSIGAHGSRVSKIDALWFFISICIYSTLAFSVCVYLVRAFSHYGINPTLYVLASGVSLIRLINFICGILILIMDMCNRRRIVNILKKITIFDREASFEWNIIYF